MDMTQTRARKVLPEFINNVTLKMPAPKSPKKKVFKSKMSVNDGYYVDR